jgi:nucleoside phosphorylase
MATRKTSNATFVIFDDTSGTIERSPGVTMNAIHSPGANLTINELHRTCQGSALNAYVVHTRRGSASDAINLYKEVEALNPTHIFYVGHSASLNDKVKTGDIAVGKKLYSFKTAKSLDKGTHWQVDDVNCSTALMEDLYGFNSKDIYSSTDTRVDVDRNTGQVTIGNGCSFSNSVLSSTSVQDVINTSDSNLMFVTDCATVTDLYKTMSYSRDIDFMAVTLVSDSGDEEKGHFNPSGDQKLAEYVFSLLERVNEGGRFGQRGPTHSTPPAKSGDVDVNAPDIEIRADGVSNVNALESALSSLTGGHVKVTG